MMELSAQVANRDRRVPARDESRLGAFAVDDWSVPCRSCGHPVAIALEPDAAVGSAPCARCTHVNYGSRYERIDIGLSEVCNLTCIMCRRPQESEFMSAARVENVLHDAALLRVPTVSFSGGEPFIHPHFREFLALALELNFSVEVVTNGTLVRESDVPLLEKLRCVTVSVDGPRETHDLIRGKVRSWDRTMQTLAFLDRATVTWGTNTVIQAANAEALFDTWTAVRAIGRPHYMSFTHVEVVPETAHLQPSSRQMTIARDDVRRIRLACERERIHFNDSELLGSAFGIFGDKSRRYRPLRGCEIPRTFLGISNYGVFPCWHQGRAVVAPTLLEALQTPLCREIIREGLMRSCIGCNATNYSWSRSWVTGIIEAHEAGLWADGVVHLTAEERVAGAARRGKRLLPILERQARGTRAPG